MRKILVTIVGHDCPGIIHRVSRALADYGCNIVEVSQTTLLGEFAGLFSCGIPDEADISKFDDILGGALEGSGLAHWVTDAEGDADCSPTDEYEPYVVTVRGRDRLGIIPEFSGTMAGFDVNIDNLRAVSLRGDQDPTSMTGLKPDDPLAEDNLVVMFFELSVPRSVNQGAFRQALNLIAEDLEMEMSLQHRDIFEAIHRL